MPFQCFLEYAQGSESGGLLRAATRPFVPPLRAATRPFGRQGGSMEGGREKGSEGERDRERRERERAAVSDACVYICCEGVHVVHVVHVCYM